MFVSSCLIFVLSCFIFVLSCLIFVLSCLIFVLSIWYIFIDILPYQSKTILCLKWAFKDIYSSSVSLHAQQEYYVSLYQSSQRYGQFGNFYIQMSVYKCEYYKISCCCLSSQAIQIVHIRIMLLKLKLGVRLFLWWVLLYFHQLLNKWWEPTIDIIIAHCLSMLPNKLCQ